MKTPIRIGALISGSGTNLEAILNACEAGSINGRVVFAGSDRPGAAGLKKAEKRGIPTFVVDYKKIIRQYRENPGALPLPGDYCAPEGSGGQAASRQDAGGSREALYYESRAVAESRLISAMSAYPFDLLVLAGFMRKLTPYFIDRISPDPLDPRIMNIHPALLPSFPGTDGYGDTFRYGCKIGGCTVHFIDYGEDTGPIIGQRAFTIDETDTIESMKQKGLALEWELYPECIRLYAENRLVPVKTTITGKNGKPGQRIIIKTSGACAEQQDC